MMMDQHALPSDVMADEDEIHLGEIVAHMRQGWKLISAMPLTAGVVTAAFTLLILPTFTARAVYMSPHQQQGVVPSAIASIGAPSGLAGRLPESRPPTDQGVAHIESMAGIKALRL